MLDPYVGVKIPRFGSSVKGGSTTTLGFLFHQQKSLISRLRAQCEFGFKQGQDQTKDRLQVEARSHLSFAYDHFVFSALENLSLTNLATIDSKISAAAVYDQASGYAQLDSTNITPTLFTLGLGYRPIRKLSIYAQAVQALQKVEHSEKLATPSVILGVDYAHCTGFGIKAAVDLKGKLQTAANFTVNKYFSGSLLLDVRYSNDRSC